MALVRTGHAKGTGFFVRETETPVVRRIADKDDGTMSAPERGLESVIDQPGANATIAAVRGDSHRPQKQSRMTRPAHDGPKPRRANDPFSIGCDESEAVRWQSPVAQALRTLAPAKIAKGLIE